MSGFSVAESAPLERIPAHDAHRRQFEVEA
jgi:hypothetical protein